MRGSSGTSTGAARAARGAAPATGASRVTVPTGDTACLQDSKPALEFGLHEQLGTRRRFAHTLWACYVHLYWQGSA